ncbi:hypothetical protein MNBD_GAMMA12-493 [hydrothermal vent metagenome]|uniref:Uncharacterized protein n=1 Tax=hydrothermal vent metagenome TaxID=652676 RepID=A0A3B0YV78_9ZZZZ
MKTGQDQFIYEINHQILNLVCNVSREDQVVAQLLFGLPSSLVEKLTQLDSVQIDSLSHTQGCLLTLRSCADEYYWQQIISGSEKRSEDHMLNLKALSMIRLGSNRLVEGRSEQQLTVSELDTKEDIHVS